jgi:alpha-glucosidase (family GH31 glycosyl hydrolase)
MDNPRKPKQEIQSMNANKRPLLAGLITLLLLGLLGAATWYVLFNPFGLMVATANTSSKDARVIYRSGPDYLVVEALDDDLLHFEFGVGAETASAEQAVQTSPMVAKTDFAGPSSFSNDGNGLLQTTDLKIQVNPKTLCVTAVDKTRQPETILTTACPGTRAAKKAKLLTFTPENYKYVYGLGEQFETPDKLRLNWVGKRRKPPNEFGNGMEGYYGGYVGNAQFPVMYALGEKGENYSLFVDNQQAQSWDLTGRKWEVRLDAEHLRWYLMNGPNLPDLRQDYMELVGRPPVPPKKFLGLWLSEYGFDNWAEVEDKMKHLRANQFPIDGVIMDLQWYGDIQPVEQSQMGSLTWDTKNFPDPPGKIADLWKRGIGMVTIEESYVVQKLNSFTEMAKRGFLVLDCQGCDPTIIQSGWWGTGGMVDWTNPDGADYWHDWKRQPLIDMGIIGHWTDLGEPEMFNSYSYYYGLPGQNWNSQKDAHNLYNLSWSESIARGYARNQVDRRPFTLSRSGVSGSQRYGASMWSGDIASNLISLAGHLNVQSHMSFSGMDFFGSDIGGFHRATAGEDLDEIYTKWFAASALIDVPVRPHTENLCNCKETAPDRVGHIPSNRANLRLRYMLSPYYYSLAYRAHLYGEPVVPPLVYYYQADPNVRDISDEKLIGRDLLAAMITRLESNQRDVYLPKGSWINYYTNEWIDSQGEWVKSVPAMQAGLFRQPLFVRSGAILPMMHVDEKTLNLLGLRSDGSRRNELIVRVYASPEANSFTLYEDDGQTVAYLEGQVRTTELSQQQSGERIRVKIAASQGSYEGAPGQRDNIVQLVYPQGKPSSVRLNGKELPRLNSQAEFEAAASGWFDVGDNLLWAKTGEMKVAIDKIFEFIFTK